MITGLYIPRIVITLFQVSVVAVAVKSITLTLGGMKLRISPSLEIRF